MLKSRIYIKEALSKKIGSEVVIAGFVEKVNLLGKLAFLNVLDKTGKTQVFVSDSFSGFKDLNKITPQSCIAIKGKIKESKKKDADKEIELTGLEVLNFAETPLPVDLVNKTTSLDKRLDYRFLDIRNDEVSAIFKIRSSVYRYVVDFYANQGFTIINTPKITTIGLESGAESFQVDYFGKKAVLAQSPQFYKQMFVISGFEKVMEIGQVYRAEKSHTTRHLTEFTGIDFEMGFIHDENDVMDVIENMFKYVLEKVKDERKDELKILSVELKVPKKIPRIPMSELKKMLAKKGKKLTEDDDLDAEAEKMIGEYILKEFNEEFVFVTRYPIKVRPFYHMRPEDNKKETKSFDLLWRGVEIATGAQREHRLKILQQQAKEKGVKIPKIYEDIFRYGAMPHGGVGFGLDRITQRMLNLDNTREGCLLPRDVERVTP